MFTVELLSGGIVAFLCLMLLPGLLFICIASMFFGYKNIVKNLRKLKIKKNKTLFFMMFVSCYVGVGCWRAYKVWGDVDWVGVLSMFLPTSFWHIAGSLILAFLYHFQEKYKIDL